MARRAPGDLDWKVKINVFDFDVSGDNVFDFDTQDAFKLKPATNLDLVKVLDFFETTTVGVREYFNLTGRLQCILQVNPKAPRDTSNNTSVNLEPIDRICNI